MPVNVNVSVPTGPEDLIPLPGLNFTLSMGGGGGDGGRGGNVTVHGDDTMANIATKGVFATGILAQSVGGGGGAGGDARSLKFGFSANPIDYVTEFIPFINYSYLLTFGGRAGAGGTGNDVTVNGSYNITTDNAYSDGIVAQSVGGGGGMGGGAFSFELSTTDIVPDVPVLEDIIGLTDVTMTMEGARRLRAARMISPT